MTHTFHQRIAALSDEQLKKMLTADRPTYRAEAIEAAEQEFSLRFPGTPLPAPAVEDEDPDQELLTTLDRNREAVYRAKKFLNGKEVHKLGGIEYTIADKIPKDTFMSDHGRISVYTYWSRFAVWAGTSLAGYLCYAFETPNGFRYMACAFVATFFVTLVQGIKRMHDHNKSGWFLFVPFYNIWLLASDGDIGPNKYGKDPQGRVPLKAEQVTSK